MERIRMFSRYLYIRLFSRYVSENEEGATAIEYGLIAGLIAVVIIAALLLLGPKLNSTFKEIVDKL